MYGSSEKDYALRHYCDGIEFATKNVLAEIQLVTFKIQSRFVQSLRLRLKTDNGESLVSYISHLMTYIYLIRYSIFS